MNVRTKNRPRQQPSKTERMYIPVQSNKIYQQIADQIEQRILNGELRSGDRLPTERELAGQFGVSRTAVREAMKSLAQRGLVDMKPGRGTRVIDGTSMAMRRSLGLMLKVGHAGLADNLVEVRGLLEPEIAALAALRATEEDLATMQEAIHSMDASLRDVNTFIAADNHFHQTLARGTQNILILTLVDSIVDLLSEQRKLIFAVSGGPERGQVHHKLILDAVKRHDAQAAREAMRLHLEQVREDVIRAATSPGEL